MKIFHILAVLLTVSAVSFADDIKGQDMINVSSGKDFAIVLKSNMTTGYGWELAASLDDKIIRFVKKEYIPDDTGMVGSGGKEVWTFMAVGEGESSVSMKYVRPWEKNVKPAEERTFLVKVHP